MTDDAHADAPRTTALQQRTPERPSGPAGPRQYSGGDPRPSARSSSSWPPSIMDAQAMAQKKASRHGVPHGSRRGPCTPRRPWPSTTPSCGSSTTCREDLRPSSPSPARRTAPSCGSPTPSGRAAGGPPSPTCAAWRCACSRRRATSHDLLMTNFPVSHARDARQFVEFAQRHGRRRRLQRVLGVLRGWSGCSACARRCACSRTSRTAATHQPGSVATETYWSRGALRWGPHIAVRYLLRPAPGTPPRRRPSRTDPAYLSTEAATPARPPATCAWSCASSASATRGPRRSRTPRRVDRARPRRPSRSRC